jgi:hypothetical protein
LDCPYHLVALGAAYLCSIAIFKDNVGRASLVAFGRGEDLDIKTVVGTRVYPCSDFEDISNENESSVFR